VKVTKRQLRRLIREVLIKEQVIGYTPPEEKGDDDDDGGYLDVGDMGVDISQSSEEGTQASGQAVRSLTQQRQQDLDTGDVEAAETDKQQLATAQKMRG
jgi:hypothetical protein